MILSNHIILSLKIFILLYLTEIFPTIYSAHSFPSHSFSQILPTLTKILITPEGHYFELQVHHKQLH